MEDWKRASWNARPATQRSTVCTRRRHMLIRTLLGTHCQNTTGEVIETVVTGPSCSHLSSFLRPARSAVSVEMDFWKARGKCKDWFMCAGPFVRCSSKPWSTHFWFATALLCHPSASVRANGAMFEFIEVIVLRVWSAALWAQEVPASGWLHREERGPEFMDHINRKKFPCSMKWNSPRQDLSSILYILFTA